MENVVKGMKVSCVLYEDNSSYVSVHRHFPDVGESVLLYTASFRADGSLQFEWRNGDVETSVINEAIANASRRLRELNIAEVVKSQSSV